MIELVPLTAEQAKCIADGDLTGFERTAGWPHDDTVDGLSFFERGAPGWLVALDDVVIGDCGTTGPLGAEVEIGFGLAAECRGRGYGTEVVRLLVDVLDRDPIVTSIVAQTLPENSASRRVLEKAGFAFDGQRDGLARYVRRSG